MASSRSLQIFLPPRPIFPYSCFCLALTVIKEIFNRDILQERAYQPSAFAIRDFYTYSTSVISCKQFANTFSFCLIGLAENIIKLLGAMGSFGALEQFYGIHDV